LIKAALVKAALVKAVAGAAGGVLRKPVLWPTVARQGWRIARGGPSARGYVRFRMITQYGGTGTTTPEPDDVIAYLTWCRAMHALDS
jgi:hypothetical protein